ncbi:NADH-quinone oxidoreductase subunit M [Candidatus Zinderia endosymbiont of Aphrophora alni]|uniref:complex I subunit 4 family protein n=1 Tax=Candidatus Zinderia endosymbiont of Aphrophora alni TaxID=3077951 RepID=UPI0030D505CC
MKLFLHILSFSIWLPILCGIFLILINNYKNNEIKKYISLISAIISFIPTLLIIYFFKNSEKNFQFSEKIHWIKCFNINYHLGIDGISLWFIPLTALTTLITILLAWDNIKKNISQYFGLFLILSGLMIGVFSSIDSMLFYIFLETTLIPIFIIIGIWGGKKKIYATFKFFFYTLLGSITMLLALIYLYIKTKNFDITSWYNLPLTFNEQKIIFLAFFFAFAIKLPIWPFHTWLPEAHGEAPTNGSIILAAIMLKFGAYGILRFLLPITPEANKFFAPIIIILSLFSIVYIGLITIVQKDIKKLIAYSSINHMGIVTIGIFLLNKIGILGAIIQMISHIFTSIAMFSLIGIIYEKTKTKKINNLGKLIKKIPIFSTFFIILSLANCGLPSTSSFVGEFLVIISAIKYNFYIGIITSTILIWSAIYSFLLIKRIIFDKTKKCSIKIIKDINKKEFFVLFIITSLIFIIGIFPKIIITPLETSITNLLS